LTFSFSIASLLNKTRLRKVTIYIFIFFIEL